MLLMLIEFICYFIEFMKGIYGQWVFYPHIKKLLNTHLRLEMKMCYGVGLHNTGYIAVGSVMSDQRAEIAL